MKKTKGGKFNRKRYDETQGNGDKQAVLNDIRAKWDRFSEQDVAALKGKDDLVSQLQTKDDMKPDQARPRPC